MTHQRHKGVIFSALLHVIWLILAIFGLPLLVDNRPPPEPAAISVELLPISELSNVKPSQSEPAPEEKKEEKKPDQKKPTPPVKTADTTPPPPPKPSDVVKPQPKPEEKKPEQKKPPEKTKAKDEDLAAVLKAVKDSASKEKPDSKSKDTSKSLTKSTHYDNSLPMSMSEKDAIKNQFAKCWSPPIGAKDAHDLDVLIELELAQDGTVLKAELASASKSRANSDGFFRAAADSALRAVHECSPLKNLPPEKYETWHYMELNFDPKEMLF